MARGLLFFALVILVGCNGRLNYGDLSDAQTVEVARIFEDNVPAESVVRVRQAHTIFSRTVYPNGLTIPRGDFELRLKADGDTRRSLYFEFNASVPVPGSTVGSQEPIVVANRTLRVPWTGINVYDQGNHTRSIFTTGRGTWVIVRSTTSPVSSMTLEVAGGPGQFDVQVPLDMNNSEHSAFVRGFQAAIEEVREHYGQGSR
jgi:hypothetical protein